MYGGTKAELERLIQDASTYTDVQKEMGLTVDESSMSFDNIVNAIAVVQGHLGIAGATAEEAASTISGSVSSMKSAWSNLVVGLADDEADIEELIDNFVDSVISVGENLLPRINTGVAGVSKLLRRFASDILPMILDILIDNLPMIIEGGIDVIAALIEGLIKALPQLVKAIPKIIRAIFDGLMNGLPTIVNAGMVVADTLWDGLSSAVKGARTWGADLVDNFIDGIKAKINSLISTVAAMAQTVRDYIGFSEPKKGPLSNFHTYAPDMMDLFIKGIKENEGKLIDQIESTFNFGERTMSAVYDVKVGGSPRPSSVGGVSVIQNIYSQAKTAADLMQEARYQQEKAVYLGV